MYLVVVILRNKLDCSNMASPVFFWLIACSNAIGGSAVNYELTKDLEREVSKEGFPY